MNKFSMPFLKEYFPFHLFIFLPKNKINKINKSFLDAPPTAELEPITQDYVQSDEVRIIYIVRANNNNNLYYKIGRYGNDL